MWQFAVDARVPAVLTNAVRHVEPSGARTVDVLDAIRRLVPLDARHLDRSNAEGYLKSSEQMWQIAEEIAEAVGGDSGLASHSAATQLMDATNALAARCVLDPVAHVGLGEVHLPELEVIMGHVSAESLDTAWDRPLALDRSTAALTAEAAVVALSQALHEELRPQGLRIQALCPGIVATEFHTRQGMDLSALPRMSAEDVVTANLKALVSGEVVCAPGVESAALLHATVAANLAAFGGQSPQLAERYRTP